MLRYLVFAQLFLLVGLAASVSRIRDLWIRNVVAAVLVINGAAIQVDSWFILAIPNKPGMKAAVAFVEANGRADEQVIVSTSLLYFPAIYYFTDRARCHLYSDGKPEPHYRGGPLVTGDELIVKDQMERLGPGRVWVISGGWAPVELPIPSTWRLQKEEQFPEVFGFQREVIVKLYEIPSVARGASH